MDDERQWRDLPKELLGRITKLLDTRIDILRVRAVCSWWRSSVPQKNSALPARLPFPIAPNPDLDPNRRGCFSLRVSTIFRMEPLPEAPNLSSDSPISWVVRVEEPQQGKMRLLNPLTKGTVSDLPETFPKVLSLLDYRVLELGSSYSLQYVDLHGRPRPEFGAAKSTVVKKVAASYTAAGDYAIMAIDLGGQLGILRSGDKNWTAIDTGKRSYFHDVIHHKGQFYAVDSMFRTVVIDSSLRVVRISPAVYSGNYKQIVSASGDLLLVDRHIDPMFDPAYPVVFKVYQLKAGAWVHVDSVGHHVLFLAEEFSLSISVRDLPEFERNYIYFCEEFYPLNEDDRIGDGTPVSNVSLYNIKNWTVGPLSFYPKHSQIIWPPPTWLSPDSGSSHTSERINGEIVIEFKWSELPKDLLTKISKFLATRTDILHLRAVCSSWRSSVPLTNSPLPLKLPFPIAPNHELNPKRCGHFSLIASTIYRFEPPAKSPNLPRSNASPESWLLRVEEEKDQGKVRLQDPIRKGTIEEFPETFPKVLNLLDYRVSELAKAYSLQYVHLGDEPCATFGELKSIHIKKVAVSSSAADDYAIMAIHTAGKLGILRPREERWTTIHVPEVPHFDDIVYHDGKFYAVDIRGRTVAIDSSLRVTEAAPSIYGGYDGGQYKHLVSASEGDLLLVDRQLDPDPELVYDWEMGEYVTQLIDPECPILFKVYRLRAGEWVQVESLGHRMLLLADEFSLCISARDFAGCVGNCIYFTDDFFLDEDEHGDGTPGSDAGLFNIGERTVGPLSSSVDHLRVIWPPPTWLRVPPS